MYHIFYQLKRKKDRKSVVLNQYLTEIVFAIETVLQYVTYIEVGIDYYYFETTVRPTKADVMAIGALISYNTPGLRALVKNRTLFIGTGRNFDF